MVTVLIFRSLFLIGAILESSSLALKQQRSRTKTTTIPTLLTPVNSKHTLTKARNWIPLRAITLSTPEYNRFAISTTIPSISDTKGPKYRAVADVHNPYKYYESEQLSRHQFHNVPQTLKSTNSESRNQGKPVNKNYVIHTNPPGKFQMNSEPQNFVATSIPLSNSNRHNGLQKSYLSTPPNFPHLVNHNSYTTHPAIRNEQYHSSNIQAKSTVPPDAQYSKEQFNQRYTGMPTESPSLRESSETFKPFQSTLYDGNKFQFAESIPVIENKPSALSDTQHNVKPNLKAKIEFSDEDFDTLFDTQLYTSPKSLNIPVHMNGNIDSFGSTKATSMNEHYQRLSDQPQLHFHMNPSQQTLYNSHAFGNIGSTHLRGRDRMYYDDLPKRDENGVIVSLPVRENFENMESFETFENGDFSEMPDSSIFRSYDKIFGKYSKIKPEAFKGEKVQVQSHSTAPRNQENKQEEEEEEYVDEYRSEESSSDSQEKYENGKDGEDQYKRGKLDNEEKTDEDTRLENFEESDRKELPYRGSQYAKETPADSSEISEAKTDRRNVEDNRRSIENDESHPTTKFPPFRYKSFQQKPLAFASDRKCHRSNNLQKHRKESSHSA